MAERFEIVEKAVLKMLEDKKYATLRDILVTMNPSDVAGLFDGLEEKQIPLMYRLLPKELAADAENGFLHGHIRPQGHIFHGHQGPGGVFGVAQNLVDGVAHFRVRVGQDSSDHVGGHLLYKVRRVIHIQFVQDFL